MLRSLF